MFFNVLPDFPEENDKAQFQNGTVRVRCGRCNVALDPIVNDIASAWIDDMEVCCFAKCSHWLASKRPTAVTRHLRDIVTRPCATGIE